MKLFLLIFTEPGVHLLAHPCRCMKKLLKAASMIAMNLKQIDHEHSLINRKFPTFDDALEYVKFLGLDEEFKIESTARNYRHFRCSRHGNYNPKKYSTKKNLKCDAKFSITTAKNGESTLSGCIVHNHKIEVHHMKIPATKKIELIAQLRDHSYTRN